VARAVRAHRPRPVRGAPDLVALEIEITGDRIGSGLAPVVPGKGYAAVAGGEVERGIGRWRRRRPRTREQARHAGAAIAVEIEPRAQGFAQRTRRVVAAVGEVRGSARHLLEAGLASEVLGPRNLHTLPLLVGAAVGELGVHRHVLELGVALLQ